MSFLVDHHLSQEDMPPSDRSAGGPSFNASALFATVASMRLGVIGDTQRESKHLEQ